VGCSYRIRSIDVRPIKALYTTSFHELSHRTVDIMRIRFAVPELEQELRYLNVIELYLPQEASNSCFVDPLRLESHMISIRHSIRNTDYLLQNAYGIPIPEIRSPSSALHSAPPSSNTNLQSTFSLLPHPIS